MCRGMPSGIANGYVAGVNSDRSSGLPQPGLSCASSDRRSIGRFCTSLRETGTGFAEPTNANRPIDHHQIDGAKHPGSTGTGRVVRPRNVGGIDALTRCAISREIRVSTRASSDSDESNVLRSPGFGFCRAHPRPNRALLGGQ